ncbi:hypothetical protein [Dysgonomonas termitidis]|uniref:Uncharacterized protein n=1 Tax=Dysgonomonas termitidis TaxID=1516126 RepID=A0ABV9KWN5_9BACT
MKKIILLTMISCSLFYIKSNAQVYKELKTNIELPKLKIINKKLEKNLISDLININNKDEWNTNLVYSIQIDKVEKRQSYKLTITMSAICDINESASIGFFKIQDYIFVVKGVYPCSLYSISTEKKIFECIKEYRIENDILEPILPLRVEPPIWIYLFEKNKLRCIEMRTFN